MQNIDAWKPTKFCLGKRGWEGTSDPRHLHVASRYTATRAVRVYQSAIEHHARGHLVDLGCGDVPLYAIYRPHVSSVTCVDWSGSDHGSAHIDIYADLNQPLPVASETADTVLSTSVLEHIWRHDILWSEMARIVAPGGKVILGVPFLYQLHEEPFDFFRWTRHALTKACEQNDLHVVELTAYGGGLDVLADLSLKLWARRTRHGLKVANKVSFLLLEKGPLRRFSDRSMAKMPLGHVVVAQKPSGPRDRIPSA